MLTYNKPITIGLCDLENRKDNISNLLSESPPKKVFNFDNTKHNNIQPNPISLIKIHFR